MKLLLVEDDPVSRAFLAEALAAGGHEVHACADAASARRAAGSVGFDRLLLDLQLGDARGDDLLADLRRDPAQRNAHVPAIALTAELDAAGRSALRDAGFACVARKPLDCRTLLALVEAAHGPATAEHPDAIWDDAAALAVLGGSTDAVRRLRGLLLAELPGQRRRIVDALASADADAARAELHRLRASTAFCGAAALGRATRALGDALAGGATDAALQGAFERACDELLGAGPASA